jgi:hypothetical protein
MQNKEFNPKRVWEGKEHPSFVLYDYKAKPFYDFVQRRKGYTYAMQPPDREGLLKIGRTAKNPFIREKNLSTAGILGKFELLWVAEFANAPWAETAIHRALSDYNKGKEFFMVSLSQVKEIFIHYTDKEDKLLEGLNRDILISSEYETWISSLDVKEFIDNTYFS